MFKIKIYCNDNGKEYWEDSVGTYKTYDKALISCFRNALQEASNLMQTSDGDVWFEAEECFEVTEGYVTEILNEEIFDVATICYDHPPYDRENDCHIHIVTGYLIEEV